jgi:hypothetical protein
MHRRGDCTYVPYLDTGEVDMNCNVSLQVTFEMDGTVQVSAYMEPVVNGC